MTATTSVRHTVKKALVDKLSVHPALEGVQKSYGWPGDALERESVYVAKVTGTVTLPLLNAGRRIRNDEFTVTVIVQAGLEGGTEEEAEERCSQLYAAVEDVLADDATIDGVDGLLWSEVASVEGPMTMLTNEGAVSMFVVEVSCHARYA